MISKAIIKYRSKFHFQIPLQECPYNALTGMSFKCPYRTVEKVEICDGNGQKF